MERDSTTLIENWFAERDGDGEFVRLPRAFPYSVIGPSNSESGSLLFTSKPHAVEAAFRDEAPVGLAMVGRYGLPHPADVDWIRGMAPTSGIMFLGDMDPVDLLVFSLGCAFGCVRCPCGSLAWGMPCWTSFPGRIHRTVFRWRTRSVNPSHC